MASNDMNLSGLEERPSTGREAYLQRRRSATRAAILLAAKEVFADSDYVHAKIEDIIRAAGVSRATFYAHFESKLELAYAIYDEIAPQSTALFAKLPEAADNGLPSVIAWLRGFVGIHVEHRYVTPLIAQLQLFESGFRERILSDAEAIIDQLAAAGAKGFVMVQGGSADALRQRVRVRLVLNRAAMVCAQIASDELPRAEAEIALELVATEVLQFMQE